MRYAKFKIIAIFLKNIAGFYVVHKDVYSEILRCTEFS